MRNIWQLSCFARAHRGTFLGACLTFLFSTLVSIVQLSRIYIYRGPIEVYINVWHIYSLGFILNLLLLLSASEPVNSWLAMAFVKTRFKDPKAGVLNLGDAKTSGAQEGFLASDWCQLLPQGMKTFDVQSGASLRDYRVDVIVNPLTEVYAETDLANRTSLKALTQFIDNGGVVVCGGGLPFFWMVDYHDLSQGIQGFTGSFLDMYAGSVFPAKSPDDALTVSMQRTRHPRLASLLDTWLYKTFGIMTTLGDAQDVSLYKVNDSYFSSIIKEGEQIVVKEFRSPFRCDSEDSKLIPLVKASWQFDKHSVECYPIAAINHGAGYVLIFAMRLESKNKELISAAIASVLKKLKEKGHLD